MKWEDIHADVQTGIERFKKRLAPRRNKWRRGLKFYHGVYDEDSFGDQRVVSNLVFGFVHRIIPASFFKNPTVAATPRGKTPREYAKLQELIVNLVMHLVKAEFEARKAIFDTLFKGVGFVKVGMHEREMVGRGAPEGITQEQLLEALGMAANVEAPQEFLGEVERGSKEDLQAQIDAGFKETVRPNFPYMVRIPPEHICPDPYATCVDDARWIAQLILMPREEFEKSGIVSKERARGIEATYELSDDENVWNVDYSAPRDLGLPTDASTRSGLIELWEVWYKPTRKVYTFSWYEAQLGETKPLQVRDWPYDFDEFPFEDLRFNPDPDSWFAVADVSTWLPLVTAYNVIQNKQVIHLNRFVRRYAVPEQCYDSAMEEALRSNEDGVVVKVSGGGQDATNKVVPIQDAAISSDTYTLKQQVMNDLTFISGVTHQRQGYKTRGEMTATEASMIEGMSQLRDNDRLFMVSKFMEGAARKLLQISRQSLSLGETLFLTQDPQVAAMWKRVSPLLNRSEVDVSVRVGSTAFRTQEVRTGQFMQAINMAAPWVDYTSGQPRPLLNMVEAARRLFEYFDIDSPDALFLAPNPGSVYLPQRGMSGGVGGMEASREMYGGGREAPRETPAEEGGRSV